MSILSLENKSEAYVLQIKDLNQNKILQFVSSYFEILISFGGAEDLVIS
jgi:hypothetical protein